MKKSLKNIFSAAALLMFTATAAFADGSGIKAQKKVAPNAKGDGYYTLTLETWAEGVINVTSTTTHQPLDAVLVLDVSGSMSNSYKTGQTRLAAMQDAATSFIDLLAQDATNNDIDHKISIIQYSSNEIDFWGNIRNLRNKVLSSLLSLKVADNVITLKSHINGLKAGGGTEHDAGLSLAYDEITSNSNDTRSRVVIMLTDGHPTGSKSVGSSIDQSDWDEDVVKGAIQNSNSLKSAGVSVFTVSILSDGSSGNLSAPENYLDHLSSDYRSDVGYKKSSRNSTYTFSGTKTSTNSEYFKRAASGDLSGVFTNILKESLDGLSSSTLNSENSSVNDYITPQFKLSSGSAEDIRTFIATIEGSDSEGNPLWSVLKQPTETIDVNFDTDDKGITSVIVSGFDFSTHFVGKTDDGTNRWNEEGQKLVIEIDVKYDPSSDDTTGGVVPTNTDLSGVYSIGSSQPEATFEKVEIFNVPQAVMTEAYLHIVKAGLALGESAIFTVSGAGNDPFTVMVTPASEGAAAEAFVKVKWLNEFVSNVDDLTTAKMVEFTVTENGDWTWKNQTPETVTHVLMQKEGEAWKNIPFKFGTVDKEYEFGQDEKSAVIKQ